MLDGFDLNTVHKLSSWEKRWSQDSSPGLLGENAMPPPKELFTFTQSATNGVVQLYMSSRMPWSNASRPQLVNQTTVSLMEGVVRQIVTMTMMLLMAFLDFIPHYRDVSGQSGGNSGYKSNQKRPKAVSSQKIEAEICFGRLSRGRFVKTVAR